MQGGAADGRHMLDLLSDCVAACDRDGLITYWNAAAEALYGWTQRQAVGAPMDELLRSSHPTTFADRRDMLAASGSWNGEIARETSSGAALLVDARWSAHRDASGDLVEIIEVGRDVTEQRRAADALRLNEARFRNLFDYMPIAIWQLDTRGSRDVTADLLRRGVADLRAHAAAHPEMLRRVVDSMLVSDANPEAVRLLGAENREQLIGPMSRFWSDMGSVLEATDVRLRGGESFSSVAKLDTFDGRQVDVLFSIAAADTLGERGISLIGAIDITERRRSVEALARSEAKYRNLFQFMPIAIWQIDTAQVGAALADLAAAGVTDLAAHFAERPGLAKELYASIAVTQANEQAVRLFGGDDEASILPRINSLWDDYQTFVDAAVASNAGARSYSAETTINTVDGRRVDLLYHVAFSDPNNPDSVNLVGAVDISERKRATAALAQSELKYRNLFQHMPLSLWQIDVSELMPALGRLRSEGVDDLDAYIEAHPEFIDHAMDIMRVRDVNDRTVKLFGGTEPSDFLGPIERFWRDSPGTLRRSLVARFGGAESYAEETRVRSLDGRLVDVFYTSAFPEALSALGIGLVGAVDIGSRLEAERLLKQVRADFAHAARVATLGELAASIAHEVNQPLAAITTNGEASLRWLARPEPDVVEVRQLAERMVADARRAADIITRIRAMAAPLAPQQSVLSANSVVEDTLRFLRHEFLSHHVSIDLELAPELPDVLGDRTQLQQVLINFVVNAMQAQHGLPDPRITLRTASTADGVRVEVEDNGPGIAPDAATRLFESFYTTKEGGLGIGLAICRTIIEAHGGRIEGRNVSQGACFSFTLPRASAGERVESLVMTA